MLYTYQKLNLFLKAMLAHSFYEVQKDMSYLKWMLKRIVICKKAIFHGVKQVTTY